MLDINYSRERHFHLIVGFQQLQPSPSLGHITMCHQIQTPTLLWGLER